MQDRHYDAETLATIATEYTLDRLLDIGRGESLADTLAQYIEGKEQFNSLLANKDLPHYPYTQSPRSIVDSVRNHKSGKWSVRQQGNSMTDWVYVHRDKDDVYPYLIVNAYARIKQRLDKRAERSNPRAGAPTKYEQLVAKLQSLIADYNNSNSRDKIKTLVEGIRRAIDASGK